MGWLKKKFRQLDKRIRKIFGKKAWLKVAALIAGTYMGLGGVGSAPGGGPFSPASATRFGPGTLKGTTAAGKFGSFMNNLGSGIKRIFWKPAGTTTSTSTTGGVVTTTTTPTKAGLTWAGQTTSRVGVNMLAGYGQAKLLDEPARGQQVFAGSNEPRTIDTIQTAYNNYSGQPVNILEAYNNLDYGTASLRTAQNIIMGSTDPKQFINITA
jgi:hypothetical protein